MQTINNRFLIPEWEKQQAVLLAWPHQKTDWSYMLNEVQKCYVGIIAAIAKYEDIILLVDDLESVKIELNCLDEDLLNRVHFVKYVVNDTWVRDSGFLTVKDNGLLKLLDFKFNGWGGKFDATLDNNINSFLYESNLLEGIYEPHLNFELEGGSIEVDDKGQLLTTASCLLNKNRGHNRTQAFVEQELSNWFGVSNILWLFHGELEGDDTDGHIDTIARLCPNNTILYVKSNDRNDSHFEALTKMEQELKSFKTVNGSSFTLVPLPMPDPIYDGNRERLPATYANYLIINDAVLVPTYGQDNKDRAAIQAISSVFKDREIVGVDCKALIFQHGSLHCSTMQLY